jgi:hypothetical protein
MHTDIRVSSLTEWVTELKSTAFYLVTPCCISERARRFGGAYHILLQGLAEAGRVISLYLPWLFFGPESGHDMLLRNVGPSPNYTALQHSHTLHTHRSEILESRLFI